MADAILNIFFHILNCLNLTKIFEIDTVALIDNETEAEKGQLILKFEKKLNQIDLIDIYRTFQLKTADYTFFSSAHGTFSRIDHILGHK